MRLKSGLVKLLGDQPDRASMRRGRRTLAVVLVLAAATLPGCGKSSASIATTTASQNAAPTTRTLVPYRARSESMAPTLAKGSTAWLEPRTTVPVVGEIYVFRPPERAEQEECGPVAHVQGFGGAACDRPLPDHG